MRRTDIVSESHSRVQSVSDTYTYILYIYYIYKMVLHESVR